MTGQMLMQAQNNIAGTLPSMSGMPILVRLAANDFLTRTTSMPHCTCAAQCSHSKHQMLYKSLGPVQVAYALLALRSHVAAKLFG